MSGTLTRVVSVSAAAAAVAMMAGHGAGAANADLIGLWTAGLHWGTATQIIVGGGNVNTGRRFNFGSDRKVFRTLDNQPLYRPEYWDELILYDYLGNSDPTGQYLDPQWKNLPMGEPLLGMPQMIVPGRDGNELVFLYQNRNTWRYIPTDCRPHDEGLSYDVSFNGHAVGCWEGDTLVVTSKGFTTDTWLGWPGWIHSYDMEVVERFTREGDVLVRQTTVNDPMLLQPWHPADLRATFNPDLQDFMSEDYPYSNRELLGFGNRG
jgi:hypothetical protein